MDEVTGPVVAVALVLCAVFVPCAFISGITGQFFRQFAITIAVSTPISAFNSLTLSPALAAILLKSHGARRDPLAWLLDTSLGWFFGLFNRGFQYGTTVYARAVGGLLRVSLLVLNAPNFGSLYVMLQPFQRRRGAGLYGDEIADQLRARFRREIREAVVTVFGAPPIDGLGSAGGFKLMIEDRGNLGLAAVQKAGDEIVAQGNQTSGLQGLFNSSRADRPWLYLEIERTKCMALGVSLGDLFDGLQAYFGSY